MGRIHAGVLSASDFKSAFVFPSRRFLNCVTRREISGSVCKWRSAWITSPAGRPAPGRLRGAARNTSVNFPSDTRRGTPSVRMTILAGTWSDNPSAFAGVSAGELPLRVASFHQRANGCYDVWRSLADDRMLTRQIVKSPANPANLARFTNRLNACLMASGLPKPSKCLGENTEAPRLDRIDRSIETPIGWAAVLIGNCHKNCLVFVTRTSQF